MRNSDIGMPGSGVVKTAVLALEIGLVGAGIAALAAFVAAKAMEGRATMIGDIVAVTLSLLFGYPAGACIGLIFARRFLRQRGSLVLGVGGVVIGAVLTMVLAEPLHLNVNTSLLMTTYACSVAILGSVGYRFRDWVGQDRGSGIGS